ncbi:MAG: hypothetical protein HF309_05770 [Ignavibacteria bacterium]|jgi:hypothetical protein|nr:hypothetical protein [Ignavibacteria bacterium]MCU7520587.1 hypothetical protein [Ignavibacteria bacterium]
MIFVYLAALLFTFCNLKAQDIQSLEKKYNYLAEKLQQEDSILTVLKNSLSDRARQIDYEKKKSSADRNKITSLMSNSINLSSQIEHQQKKVQNIFTELEAVKHSLNSIYGENLEKLQSRKKAAKNSQEISSIDSEILLLMGKKLAVMPYMPKFSSDPGRIKSLEISGLSGKEKDIYDAYLKTALNETETQLNQVNIVYRETEQVLKLRKKTHKFLQEAEMERGIHPAGKVNNSTVAGVSGEKDSHVFPGYESSSAQRNTTDMIQSQALLFSQLNPERSREIERSLKTIIDTSGKKFSLNAYFNLLKDLKRSLEDYRNMLLSKTGSSR